MQQISVFPSMLATAREGFFVPGAEAFYGKPIISLSLFGVDVSINRTVVLLFLATLATFSFYSIAFKSPKLVPRGIQNIAEAVIDFVRNQIILPTMGAKGLPYLNYLTVMFSFIFFCNILEVLPGISFPATSRLAIPAVLAVGSLLVFVVTGVRNQGISYFKNAVVPAGVPIPVLFILIPLEILSVFVIRPVTLTLRLTANMIAGHMLLTVFFLGTAYLFGRQLTVPFGFVSVFIGTAFVGFEIFVAGLQAFVFAILTAVYISGSIESNH